MEDRRSSLHCDGSHETENCSENLSDCRVRSRLDNVNIEDNLKGLSSPRCYIPNVAPDFTPHVDMEFGSYDEAFTFYNSYARLGGFSVRKYCNKKVRGELSWATFVCNKQGYKDERDEKKKRRIFIRCGCLAKIIVCLCLKTKKWIVNNFEASHNHCLHSPSKFNMHRSTHGLTSPNKQSMVDKFARVGLRPTDLIKLLATEEGIESVPFTKKHIYNYLQNKAKNYTGIDWQSPLDYFTKKRQQDPNFYYSIQVDEDNQVCNCFWIDGISREDYHYFGDVISFDITYKKNQYEMSFASFIAINHHNRSIIVGCALLGDEKIRSFVWLFEEWLKAVGGKAPNVIFTDQDPAMRAAINTVLPNTIHRLCLWHIQQKFSKHLSGLYIQYPDSFQDGWNQWFHHSDNKDVFEKRWNDMIHSYPNIIECKWVTDLWSDRHSWASHYSPNAFTAGINTTQRSEIMNAMFHGWFTATTPVRMFVERLDDILKGNRYQEKQDDFHMNDGLKPCLYDSPLLKHIQELFTPPIFQRFQEEFGKIVLCHAKLTHMEGEVKLYKVLQIQKNKNLKEYDITYQESVEEVCLCKCQLCNKTGIVCSHILTVFRAECIHELPQQYILNRWSRKAKEDATNASFKANTSDFLLLKTNLWNVKVKRCMQVALKNEHSFKEACEKLDALTLYLEDKYTTCSSNNVIDNGVTLQDRVKVRAKRMKSGISNAKERRICHVCQRAGNDARTCLQNPKNRERFVDNVAPIQGRKCHFCGGVGHDRRNCSKAREEVQLKG